MNVSGIMRNLSLDIENVGGDMDNDNSKGYLYNRNIIMVDKEKFYKLLDNSRYKKEVSNHTGQSYIQNKIPKEIVTIVKQCFESSIVNNY